MPFRLAAGGLAARNPVPCCDPWAGRAGPDHCPGCSSGSCRSCSRRCHRIRSYMPYRPP